MGVVALWLQAAKTHAAVAVIMLSDFTTHNLTSPFW